MAEVTGLVTEILAFLALMVSGVVWAIRLEGKVALTDQQTQQIIDRLVRIEALLDHLVQFNARA